KSCLPHKIGRLAQLVERAVYIRKAGGSRPSATTYAELAKAVKARV
ncbi:MAG: hypothetical protein UX03_C0004G0001, partial [Candidatus Woesebacteria bacterium GW2011_GWE1_45_18]